MELKYPEPLNDCFHAYMWILKNAKKELNLDIKYKIVLGDSAGAIMVLSLIFLLVNDIQRNQLMIYIQAN